MDFAAGSSVSNRTGCDNDGDNEERDLQEHEETGCSVGGHHFVSAWVAAAKLSLSLQ